ncbi:hypothetical protein [Ktedonobacter robiniae]|uniref:hypothetical protein n=1 Tax=Ktedonobacter robiniae TaxID=2778365 RepID=UPI003B75BD24
MKIHDTRARKKRDVALRDHQVELILYKRRFRCFTCQKHFTELDTVCGKRRRATKRLREGIVNLAIELNTMLECLYENKPYFSQLQRFSFPARHYQPRSLAVFSLLAQFP